MTCCDVDKDTSNKSKEKESHRNPFECRITVDGMAILIFILGLYLRFKDLDQPRNVVFDEVRTDTYILGSYKKQMNANFWNCYFGNISMHYGKYASLYLKRTFFFDSNPPLGKLMLAFFGYLAGYDGDFTFDKIGVAYPEDVPIWSFRFFPAFCGSTLMPLVYLIICELGLSVYTGALAGIMVLLDSALLTQSRFVLLESMMMMFSLFGVWSTLKFRSSQDHVFGFRWTFWLLSSIISLSIAFCIKFISIYSFLLCIFIMGQCFWHRLSLPHIPNLRLVGEFILQCGLIVLIPISMYIGTFYIHLSILTKAGVHDSLMTSAFQASLEGGLSSIVQGQPLLVAHGSQITLRHTHGKTCWLHSHEHVYPVRYSDARGSSHQQQVSCYGYKDVNNWWIVKRPTREDLAVHEPLDVIKDGDTIQLVHGLTHRALNSHDVAAPMSPHNQEVSCYIDYNISMASENLWKVQIVNLGSAEDNKWRSIGSQVRLIHENSGHALKFSGRMYPDWGFHQNEVCCDKNINQMDAVWNVEEHRYTKNDDDKTAIERELIHSELIPTKPTELSFMEKFIELQVKMLITNQENVQNHNYASDPTEWPFLSRGIAYYISKDTNAQVHLIGNLTIWYIGSLSVIAFIGLHTFYLLRRRRLCFDLSEEKWNEFLNSGQILLIGYLFHYVPFYFYDRTLFLHHYLPAYLYKIMLTAFVINHLSHLIQHFCGKLLNKFYLCLVTFWILGVIYTFSRISVLSYGNVSLSASEVRSLKWKDTWDLIIHKP